jgi:bisphosphoglycerate-dependent phosphoglycerate mutase
LESRKPITGWTISTFSQNVARRQGSRPNLRERGFTFNAAYTSVLRRVIRTLWIVRYETAVVAFLFRPERAVLASLAKY